LRADVRLFALILAVYLAKAPLSFTAMLHLGKLVAAVCVAASAVAFWSLCRRVAPTAAMASTIC
jgi:hypothetical protein